MNKYEKAVLECKVGIKAFQNINASSIGFSRMLDLANTEDPILLPSVFHWAVIRYAKPFLNSKFEGGKICYPTKELKKSAGFSPEIHEHLLTVRSALVAHDDFTEISPRILTAGMHIADEDFLIPTSITISNKCISFPINPDTVQKMQMHAQACCIGVHEKLIKDIAMLRELTLKNPELAMENPKYKNNYGEAKIEAEGSTMQPPNFTTDPWLNTPVPDYSKLHNGYMYEEAKINKEFHGPETIVTPKGKEYTISPTTSE
jgi:hypothetical protein